MEPGEVELLPLRLDLHLGVFSLRGATPRSPLPRREGDHVHTHVKITEAVGGVGEAVARAPLDADFMLHLPLPQTQFFRAIIIGPTRFCTLKT